MNFYEKLNSNEKQIKFTNGCNQMITHTNFEAKQKISFNWIAPKTSSGCVSIKYINNNL
jgi:hypothetical protein